MGKERGGGGTQAQRYWGLLLGERSMPGCQVLDLPGMGPALEFPEFSQCL